MRQHQETERWLPQCHSGGFTHCHCCPVKHALMKRWARGGGGRGGRRGSAGGWQVRVAGGTTAKGRRGREGGTYITQTSRITVPKELLVWQCGSGSEHSGQGGGRGGSGGRGGEEIKARQEGGGRGGGGGEIEREMLIRSNQGKINGGISKARAADRER